MNYKIGGKERIYSVLSGDQYQNPNKVMPYLKAEIRSAVSDYLNLNSDIVLRVRQTNEGYVFMVEIPVSSIKGVFSI